MDQEAFATYKVQKSVYFNAKGKLRYQILLYTRVSNQTQVIQMGPEELKSGKEADWWKEQCESALKVVGAAEYLSARK